ncbi:hypothetical protein LZK98_11400 [Sphingomonas cannabina]|uniref:hypothetical protein n=1 Tax=Sphingomonas cannabina TaxID=2899123 RepID=UPI001F1A01F3|nr:hypothetical protein [Sphingomonas cannabina]UIJ43695.1 hypothetical protein LZK98_11400 [Sphingomonas cannabina]
MPLPYATPEELAGWARYEMSRNPDFVVGPADNPYLRRWWIVPRNASANVYLHEILRSDDDRALHDHPWPNTSIVIEGRYVEHTPEGRFMRGPGDVVSRDATDAHRLEILPGERAISLFLFCLGSTYAMQLCRRFGFNPDEQVLP